MSATRRRPADQVRRPAPKGATPAVALLRQWLEAQSSMSYGVLADALGVHERLVYAWLGPNPTKRCRPGPELARAIEIVTAGAVPMTAWADPGLTLEIAEFAAETLGLDRKAALAALRETEPK